MRAPPGPVSVLFAGRYTIERVIGQGATATVHLARDMERGISVAIKMLRPELAQSGASERFLKEIRRTAALQHPNILPVLDSGEYDGQLYFALPYMEGGTLRHLLKREKILELARIVAIARPIAEALDYAHQRALIHRDVKPENILFTGGQACLGDFGIARALDLSSGTDASSASTGTVRGTAAYMSPEQAAGGTDLDGRSDGYSLACVIYEMVTGMQAFIGPTAESVISQRFAFQPREVRVYRPSAPAGIDTVLSKAFAMTPADRYRTAGELVAALQSAIDSPSSAPIIDRRRTPDGVAPAPGQGWRRFVLALSATVVVAVIAAVGVPQIRRVLFGGPVQMDTTRIALLPLEREGANVPPWRDDDLLQQGLSRWKGISVVDQFQVADAIRRFGAVQNSNDAASVASAVGAGRYIRGRLTPFGDAWLATASLYDVARKQPLYQASTDIQKEIGAAAAAYARLADSLLLRGVAADSTPKTTSTSSLPALQAFSRGQVALGEWDLVSADSAFQAAISYDADFARGHFWLAQVRAWRGLGVNAWGTFAERALDMSEQLNDRETLLARALLHLRRAAYDSACAAYDALSRREERDFAAWFGLGQCRTLNRSVIPDARSVSGYRFQMSAHRAMEAYRKAFDILPSVYRGYQRGAFQRLQVLLLLTDQNFIGYGVRDSAVFFARPGWMGDTLVLIPYPAAVMAKGGPIPPGYQLARAARRAEFRRLASSWSVAFPNSAGAKEAVALSLDRVGDPAAIDTIRRARVLAADITHRTQLAAMEMQLLVKYSGLEREDYLSKAVNLGDSLLSERPVATVDAARALVPVAILLGKCARADELLTQAGMDGDQALFSATLYVEAQSVVLRTTLGCSGHEGAMSLRTLASAIDREASSRGSRSLQILDGWLLLRPAIQSATTDREILDRVVSSTNHELANAAYQAARRDSSSAHGFLARAESGWIRGAPTPDFAFATAKTWLAIGDSSNAVRVLDVMLGALQNYDPAVFFQDAGTTSAFMAGVLMRAELAHALGDLSDQRKWAKVATRLWSRADPAFTAVMNRMSRYASVR